MATKKCKKCNLSKNLDEFYKGRNVCKICICSDVKNYQNNNSKKISKQKKKYNKIYYERNKDKMNEIHKNYRSNNKEKISEHNKKFYIENRCVLLSNTKAYRSDPENKELILEYQKQYDIDNKEKIAERKRKYYLKNKEKILNRQCIYSKNRRKIDFCYRLRMNISRAIRSQFKKNGSSKDYKSCLDNLKYSIVELKEHLEKQFESWMTWDNYGNYNSKVWDDNNQNTWTWSLDHIIPQSNFSYSDMKDEEFNKCWALENLRPYSAKQNLLDGVARVRHTDE